MLNIISILLAHGGKHIEGWENNIETRQYNLNMFLPWAKSYWDLANNIDFHQYYFAIRRYSLPPAQTRMILENPRNVLHSQYHVGTVDKYCNLLYARHKNMDEHREYCAAFPATQTFMCIKFGVDLISAPLPYTNISVARLAPFLHSRQRL